MPEQLIVVIPTAGTCDLLPRTLMSLGNVELPSCYQRTVVVENGPPGLAATAVQAAPSCLRAEYVHIERANKSNALNQIFATFDKDALVYLADDDIRFARNVLQDFASAARDTNQGAVYGGPLRIDSDQEPPHEFRPFLPGSMKGWEPTATDFNPQTAYFLGANWAVFAGDVLRVGGFDPRFGPGSPLNATGQEWSMQTALRRAGATFHYLPDAVVWHHVDFTRFSRDFLLKRRFRGGVEAGIQAADRQLRPIRWRDRFRFPATRARWRVWKHGLLAQASQLLSQPQQRLKHELLREHAKGFLYSFDQSLKHAL